MSILVCVVNTVPLFAANRDHQLSVHAGSWLKFREAALALLDSFVPILEADPLSLSESGDHVMVLRETFIFSDLMWTLTDESIKESFSGRLAW